MCTLELPLDQTDSTAGHFTVSNFPPGSPLLNTTNIDLFITVKYIINIYKVTKLQNFERYSHDDMTMMTSIPGLLTRSYSG